MPSKAKSSATALPTLGRSVNVFSLLRCTLSGFMFQPLIWRSSENQQSDGSTCFRGQSPRYFHRRHSRLRRIYVGYKYPTYFFQTFSKFFKQFFRRRFNCLAVCGCIGSCSLRSNRSASCSSSCLYLTLERCCLSNICNCCRHKSCCNFCHSLVLCFDGSGILSDSSTHGLEHCEQRGELLSWGRK